MMSIKPIFILPKEPQISLSIQPTASTYAEASDLLFFSHSSPSLNYYDRLQQVANIENPEQIVQLIITAMVAARHLKNGERKGINVKAFQGLLFQVKSTIAESQARPFYKESALSLLNKWATHTLGTLAPLCLEEPRKMTFQIEKFNGLLTQELRAQDQQIPLTDRTDCLNITHAPADYYKPLSYLPEMMQLPFFKDLHFSLLIDNTPHVNKLIEFQVSETAKNLPAQTKGLLSPLLYAIQEAGSRKCADLIKIDEAEAHLINTLDQHFLLHSEFLSSRTLEEEFAIYEYYKGMSEVYKEKEASLKMENSLPACPLKKKGELRAIAKKREKAKSWKHYPN